MERHFQAIYTPISGFALVLANATSTLDLPSSDQVAAGTPKEACSIPISEVKGQPLIKTRSPLATPKGFEDRRLALEAWVIRRTNSHIDLNDPGYRITGPADNQREHQRTLKFARALQIEYLHFHNWNGTPRPDNAITKKSRTSPTHRPSK